MSQKTLVRDEDLSGWPKTYTWNVDGTINTMVANGYSQTGNAVQYVRTFGYAGGKLTSDTGWILQ